MYSGLRHDGSDYVANNTTHFSLSSPLRGVKHTGPSDELERKQMDDQQHYLLSGAVIIHHFLR